MSSNYRFVKDLGKDCSRRGRQMSGLSVFVPILLNPRRCIFLRKSFQIDISKCALPSKAWRQSLRAWRRWEKFHSLLHTRCLVREEIGSRFVQQFATMIGLSKS